MEEARRADSRSTTSESKKISHVGLACYLWYKGHGMLSKEWRDGFCSWQFADSDTLQADIDAFYQGSALVDARNYFPRVTEFKQDMYKDKPK